MNEFLVLSQEHFRQSLALVPSARAHFGLGTSLAALRRRREALEELQKALQICPTMLGAIINLAGAGGTGGITGGTGHPRMAIVSCEL